MIVDTLIVSPTMICDHPKPTIKTFLNVHKMGSVSFQDPYLNPNDTFQQLLLLEPF